MLETFQWTGGTVYRSGQLQVVAVIDPTWNALAAFDRSGSVFGFVVDGENAMMRREGWIFSLLPGTYFAASPIYDWTTEDGWTQPIVVLPDMTIVDGFHRWTVSSDPKIRAMTGGMVPVVVIDADPMHRMMSTVRHNRARGTHAVLRMAEIVRSMSSSGMQAGEICRRLGMETEELERLLDRSGMTVRGSAGVKGFGRAWVPGRPERDR